MSQVSQQTLNLIIERLVKASEPERIIMFGSHVRGSSAENSDLDLLVIKRNVTNRGKEMVKLRQAIGKVGIGIDVLVYSEDEVNQKRNWSSSALYSALREGKVLYDSAKRS